MPVYQMKPDARPARCCPELAVEVRAEFHRLPFHRQIHEEDLVDEAGEKHSEREEKAGRVGPQAQVALPRFSTSGTKPPMQNAGRQGENDSLQRTRTPRALGAPGSCQCFMLATPMIR